MELLGPLADTPMYLQIVAIGVYTVSMFVVAALMKWVLFDPILATVDARNEKVEGLEEERDQREAELADRIEEFEERMEEKRQEAHADMQEIIEEGMERRTEMISEANDEAVQILEEAREEIRRDREEAREQLEEETLELARRIIRKTTGEQPDKETLEQYREEV